MIGDDVPRFARRSHRRPVAFIQHAWSKLQCLVYGHFYRPSYEVWGSSARYECDCCGEKTKWMTKQEHHWFNLIECPTWGDRGSDSQNYRFIGPPERNQAIWRPSKKRKRYRKTA